MQLPQPFIALPFRFDIDQLIAEVRAMDAASWLAHPEGMPGNSALPLIAVRGDARSHEVAGPMRPTAHLLRSPYLQQVLASLDVPLGRTRLMRLDSRAEAKPHIDLNYYWQRRLRIHIPILTSPGVEFAAGDTRIHMAAGSCWVFDTWRSHHVINDADTERVHLVIDTVGSESLWAGMSQPATPRFIPYIPAAPAQPWRFETVNFPRVMPPGEIAELWSDWCRDVSPASRSALPPLHQAFEQWLMTWRDQWTVQGEHGALDAYRQRREDLARRIAGLSPVMLGNDLDLRRVLTDTLMPALLTDALPPAPAFTLPAGSQSPSHFDRPIFIVAAPRSGSSMLFEVLAQSPTLVSLGRESHEEIESIAAFNPASKGYDSNALTANDAQNSTAVQQLRDNFLNAVHHHDGKAPTGSPIRLLEKTPKNALRIPFLSAIFPDALWVYLWRDPFESVGSLMDGWASQQFVTYPNLPGWPAERDAWSFLLTPGWRALQHAAPAEIAVAQWSASNRQILQDLAAIAPHRRYALSYQSLLDAPDETLARLCAFLDIAPPPAGLTKRLSSHTLTAPAKDKWRRHAEAILPHAPQLEATRQLIAQALAQWPRDAEAGASSPPAPSAAPGYGSVHTANLPDILAKLGSTLLISTYQAGKLVAVQPDGERLNTHFRQFDRPMGIASAGDRLFLGTQYAIREYRNVPDAAQRIASSTPADAVFALRNTHITGGIDIHEMAVVDGQCYYINTAFSCICLLDSDYSFHPVWRPHFVSGYSPEDRCHLNGLGLKDGQLAFLTALGTTDSPEGWRSNKRSGGVLMDFPSGEVIAAGLSMPHSPRWHNGKLWVLESGKGSLGWVDMATGKVETVVTLPGFTRGLAMAGPLAFVGMSQLREKGAFADIPVTESQVERACGVSVIHLETGQVIGFIKFSAAVQEIFALHLLDGIRSPQFVDEHEPELLGTIFSLPDHALRDVRFATPNASAN
jgi:uncharacterized protein (TIGR03032 family)